MLLCYPSYLNLYVLNFQWWLSQVQNSQRFPKAHDVRISSISIEETGTQPPHVLGSGETPGLHPLHWSSWSKMWHSKTLKLYLGTTPPLFPQDSGPIFRESRSLNRRFFVTGILGPGGVGPRNPCLRTWRAQGWLPLFLKNFLKQHFAKSQVPRLPFWKKSFALPFRTGFFSPRQKPEVPYFPVKPGFLRGILIMV